MMLAHPSPPPSEPDVKLPGRRPVQGPCKAPDGVHICPGRDPAVRLVVVAGITLLYIHLPDDHALAFTPAPDLDLIPTALLG